MFVPSQPRTVRARSARACPLLEFRGSPVQMRCLHRFWTGRLANRDPKRIPIRRVRSPGGSVLVASPEISTDPLNQWTSTECGTRPFRQRARVLLPAPLGPAISTRSPGATVSETRSRHRRFRPKCLIVRSRTSIRGALTLSPVTTAVTPVNDSVGHASRPYTSPTLARPIAVSLSAPVRTSASPRYFAMMPATATPTVRVTSIVTRTGTSSSK